MSVQAWLVSEKVSVSFARKLSDTAYTDGSESYNIRTNTFGKACSKSGFTTYFVATFAVL